MSAPGPAATPRTIGVLVGVAALVRLGTLGLYPLTDSTESRYSEIARKMLATGDVITLWFDTAVPFWGKPPLSFWSTAATMSLFGVNEFGARLAPFLFVAATIGLFRCWPAAEHSDGAPVRSMAALITSTSLLGFILGGSVMTDAALTFSTTLCMVSFWRTVQLERGAWYWGWLFFTGIGLGLLAKGPVAVVITGVAIFFWVLRRNAWALLWTRLPWIGGTVLVIAIAAPWYLLAERATPGFLRYYLIGEHLERYLVKGWTGDLYGAGRAKARGTIWLFLLAALVPWTFMLPAWIGRARRAWREDDAAIASRDYLLAWALTTPLFFTMSRNILLPYVAPALPACALLLAPAAVWSIDTVRGRRIVAACSLLLSIVAAGVLIIRPATLERASQRVFFRRRPVDAGTPVIYIYERPFSGAFYTRGAAVFALDDAAVHAALQRKEPTVVLLKRSRSAQVPATWLVGWTAVDEHAGYLRLENGRSR